MNKLISIALLSLLLVSCQYTESTNYSYNIVMDEGTADNSSFSGTADTGVTRGGNTSSSELEADVGLAP